MLSSCPLRLPLAWTATFLFFALNPVHAPSSESERISLDVVGSWRFEDGSVRIDVSDCGDGTPCGVIGWIDAEEVSPVDRANRDAELKDRPLVGTQWISGFVRKDGQWKNGQVYNFQTGMKLKAHLRLEDSKTLVLRPCFGPFCHEHELTRVTPSFGGRKGETSSVDLEDTP